MSHMCECCCGQPVKAGRRFLHGHSGHKWTQKTATAARARVEPRRVEVVDLFPGDVLALERLMTLTSG